MVWGSDYFVCLLLLVYFFSFFLDFTRANSVSKAVFSCLLVPGAAVPQVKNMSAPAPDRTQLQVGHRSKHMQIVGSYSTIGTRTKEKLIFTKLS